MIIAVVIIPSCTKLGIIKNLNLCKSKLQGIEGEESEKQDITSKDLFFPKPEAVKVPLFVQTTATTSLLSLDNIMTGMYHMDYICFRPASISILAL